MDRKQVEEFVKNAEQSITMKQISLALGKELVMCAWAAVYGSCSTWPAKNWKWSDPLPEKFEKLERKAFFGETQGSHGVFIFVGVTEVITREEYAAGKTVGSISFSIGRQFGYLDCGWCGEIYVSMGGGYECEYCGGA